MKRVPSPLVVLCALAFVAGCERPVPVHKVRGTITFQGKPLATGTVVFHPTGGSSQPVKSEVRSDGTFELHAPAGEYKVTAAATTAAHGVEGVDRDYRPASLQTPAKYIRLDETPLVATVQPHDDNAVTLSLTP